MAKKKIEEIYKEMDELTHILERPGMWVGSVKEEQKQMFFGLEEIILSIQTENALLIKVHGRISVQRLTLNITIIMAQMKFLWI